jgi:hypothetical protein
VRDSSGRAHRTQYFEVHEAVRVGEYRSLDVAGRASTCRVCDVGGQAKPQALADTQDDDTTHSSSSYGMTCTVIAISHRAVHYVAHAARATIATGDTPAEGLHSSVSIAHSLIQMGVDRANTA